MAGGSVLYDGGLGAGGKVNIWPTGSVNESPVLADKNLRIATGTVAFDGSNPTPVSTGLSVVIAAFAQLSGTSAPGTGTAVIACTPSAGGTIDLRAWKATSTSDTTLVASTGTETVQWFAVGI